MQPLIAKVFVMQQSPGYSRRLFRAAAMASAEGHRDEPHPKAEMQGNISVDFFGVEDLLAQAYEDEVYAALIR
jgi:hypothetical protein